ncbi:hypothetical protein FCV25MIE_01516 [Fagus crenata]
MRSQATHTVVHGRPTEPILHHDHHKNCSFKDAIIIGINDTKIPQQQSRNNHDSGEAFTARVDLNLKVTLGIGPTGKWKVEWAAIVDRPNQTFKDKDKA